VIDIDSMTCGYGSREVLREVSLRVAPGEMVGVLGPNGSGKSTLLLAMSGLLPPWQGSVRLAGQDLTGWTARGRAQRIAAVPQRAEASFPFRCLSVVLMGRYAHTSGWGEEGPEDLEIALTAMEETATLHLARRMINAVSGGEAQMVMIARALAQQTDVVLLDEATASLDVAHKIAIFDLLKEKNRQGATLLCVMHDLNLAALYCRRLIFLKEGRVALDGPTEATFTARNLSEVYETEIQVSRHPVTGSPQAHFVPGGGAGAAAGAPAGASESVGRAH